MANMNTIGTQDIPCICLYILGIYFFINMINLQVCISPANKCIQRTLFNDTLAKGLARMETDTREVI